MTNTSRSRLVMAVGAVCVLWAGCRDQDPVGDEKNRAPETYLVQSPEYNEAGFYINQLYWDGYDPDGQVAFFEVTVTDSAGNLDDVVWHQTFRTDSLVRFPVGGDDGTAQLLHNRFYVRAVDNLGRRDLDPAYVLFQAKDFEPPTVVFTADRGYRADWPDTIDMHVPARCEVGFPPDTLPIGATAEFRWRGVDADSLFGTGVGSVVAFEYKLAGVDSDFRGGSISDTSVVYPDLSPGSYSFFVKPIDDAGWEGEACRYFHVNIDAEADVQCPPGADPQDCAFRISNLRVVDPDFDCDLGPETAPYDYTAQNLPEPPWDPDIGNGMTWVSTADTLGVESPSSSWWVQFEVEVNDPDGEVQGLDITVLECSPRYAPWAPPGEEQVPGDLTCVNTGWNCAAYAPDTPNTVIAGPLTSGDWRIIVAGVDDTGQRGTAYADTLEIHVDRSPRLILDKPGFDMGACGCLTGAPGDTVTVCGNDTTYVVDRTQGSAAESDTPCAVTTLYADSGEDAPISALDFAAFPQPGQTFSLEFEDLDPDAGTRVASFCALLFARDTDTGMSAGIRPFSAGWVTHVRWGVDVAPGRTAGWDRIMLPGRPIRENEIVPICFKPLIIQDRRVQEHYLYVEIRDWLEQTLDAGTDVAERTSRYVIPFTVIDEGVPAGDRASADADPHATGRH